MLIAIFVMQFVLIVLLVVGFIALYKRFIQKKVTVKYEPIVYFERKLFREKVVAGYNTQIYYDGIPIGEPSEKIVYQSNKVDRDAIEKAIKDATPILTKSVMAALNASPIELKKIQEVIKKALG